MPHRSLSARFRHLPRFRISSNHISHFLPTNSDHGITTFARRYHDTKFIAGSANIVISFVAKRDDMSEDDIPNPVGRSYGRVRFGMRTDILLA